MASPAPSRQDAHALLADDWSRHCLPALVSWMRCPACRCTGDVDLRGLNRHPDAAVSSLIPALSCRSCRPRAPFAELVKLSKISIADEMREEYTLRVLGECGDYFQAPCLYSDPVGVPGETRFINAGTRLVTASRLHYPRGLRIIEHDVHREGMLWDQRIVRHDHSF